MEQIQNILLASTGEWIEHERIIVGFKYRSSQPSTDGVGGSHEYFDTSGYKGAAVMAKHFHVGRLY